MQEKIKNILSVFLNMPVEQINTATVIDRSVVSSSILLHRMYAKLAAENIIVSDYQQVRTLGDLLKSQDNQAANAENIKPGSPASALHEAAVIVLPGNAGDTAGVGIDIEMVNAMPVTDDFREDTFYTMNFSAGEISYCILQPKPYVSFAGLFAAKEAIVKADNTFKKTEFKNIKVQHLSNGKPFHPAFNISISHTHEMAVAVAIPMRYNNHAVNAPAVTMPVNHAGKTSPLIWLLVLTSVVLSVIAIFLIAGKK